LEFSNLFIIQWGQDRLGTDSEHTTTLPISYSEYYEVFQTVKLTSMPDAAARQIYSVITSLVSFKSRGCWVNSTSQGWTDYFLKYLTIGY